MFFRENERGACLEMVRAAGFEPATDCRWGLGRRWVFLVCSDHPKALVFAEWHEVQRAWRLRRSSRKPPMLRGRMWSTRTAGLMVPGGAKAWVSTCPEVQTFTLSQRQTGDSLRMDFESFGHSPP